MKPFERSTHHGTLRFGTVALAAMILAFASASGRRLGPTVAAAGAGVGAAPASTGADVTAPHGAKAVRGASPYLEISDEPAPKLIVDPPLPDLLDEGVLLIQWRAENVHILPVFGKGALNASPRIGHLHVQIDDVPWWWADASNVNTIDLAGLPAGPHKIKIELVNTNHEVFPGQSRTVTFNVAKGWPGSHSR